MTASLRKLVTLHRAALGRWRRHADRRHAAMSARGHFDREAVGGATRRMDALDRAMTRLQRKMAAA